MYKCSQNTIKKGSKVIQMLFRYYWMDVYHIVSCPYLAEFFIINSSSPTHFSALVIHFAEHKSDLKIWLQIWSSYTSIQLNFFFRGGKFFTMLEQKVQLLLKPSRSTLQWNTHTWTKGATPAMGNLLIPAGTTTTRHWSLSATSSFLDKGQTFSLSIRRLKITLKRKHRWQKDYV